MPIKDRSLYPKDWKEIVKRIRERDGNKCVFCGVKNDAVGARDRRGEWHDELSINNMNSSDGEALFGEYPKMIKIVLTTAHLDNKLDDHSDKNLASLCQKCHLNHDKDQHKTSRMETRNKKLSIGIFL